MKHLVWDWNGTLYNDAKAVVAATNDIFAPFGVTLSHDEYRSKFRRPLTAFYSDILGRVVTDAEFATLDSHFHTAYETRRRECGLALGAVDAIASWAAAGHSQSLLSLWTHDQLVQLVASYQLTSAFAAVQGRTHLHPGGKYPLFQQHVTTLRIDPQNVVMIGDALDDARTASTAGAQIVLVSTGMHHRAELEATGFPVADTIPDAVAIAKTL